MKKIGILILIVIIILLFTSFFLFLNNSKKDSKNNSINLNPSSQEKINSRNNNMIQITLTENGFEPNTATITAGTTVEWTNKSGKEATVDSDPHPIHTSYKELNLGIFKNDENLKLQFNKPGKYNYHNHFNPEDSGEIVVE
jgi:plastocyanin